MDSEPPRPCQDIDLLIFDMDGVLIDVSRSYRKTIQRTIFLYLQTCLGFGRLAPRLVTLQDIALFKSMGGFNNDWDLTSALLLFLLSLSNLPVLSQRRSCSTTEEAVRYLRRSSSTLRPEIDLQMKERILPDFAKRVKSLGGGLKAVRSALAGAKGATSERWIYRLGELDTGNLVKRIFQEVYLGNEFYRHYPFEPLFYKGPGLFRQERLLIRRKILGTLHRGMTLAIASGRPRFEAELAMKRFHLHPYFEGVVTLDECLEEENRLFRRSGRRMGRTKPDPYPLLRVLQEVGVSAARCAYVGDAVDDMHAVQRVRRHLPMAAIGFVGGARNRRAAENDLRAAGADWVIDSPEDLLRLLP